MLKRFAGTAMSALLCVSLFAGTALTSYAVAPDKEADTAEETIMPLDTDTETTESTEGAYLFVHFIGNEGANEEQMYFSVSTDGTSWKTLNNVKPVLSADSVKADGGEGGIRDPHIIRSPEGNKFYMIATDLCIYNRGGDWSTAQTEGSKSIVVWESDDLVNWSDARLCKIATDNSTDTWAPESIWDEERGMYMVFWSSRTTEHWKYRVYRCYTSDFKTFTEPEVYIDSDGSRIDTTFIKEGDTYYRFTKNEDTGKKYVYMEKGKSLSGEFEVVSTFTVNGKHYTDQKTALGGTNETYEGPTAYKLHGENKWCLLLDDYDYKPFITDDISTGRFVSATAFNFNGVRFRHGTVMPITMEEYERLTDKYANDKDITEGDLVYELDFENSLNAGSAGTVKTAATPDVTPTYEAGVNGGQAIKLNGNYVTLPSAALAGAKSMTISFATKINSTANSWLFYAAPNNDTQTYQKEKYIGGLWNNGGGRIEFERYDNNGSRSTSPSVDLNKDTWYHITLVYHVDKTDVYRNGEFVETVASSVSLTEMLGNNPVIYLGKANWEGGQYATNLLLDCFKVHNYVLDEAAIKQLYKDDMGSDAIGDVEDTEAALVYSLNISADSVATGSGSGTVSEKGTLAYEQDQYGHNAVKFSENNWLEITGAPIAGLTSFSVTFAVKSKQGYVAGDYSSWLFYAVNEEVTEQNWSTEKYLGICWQPADSGRIRAERYNNNGSRSNALLGSLAQDTWAYVTVVYRAGNTTLYINGIQVARESSIVDIAALLGSNPVIKLGKADWGSGEYADAALSCFEIYSGALSDEKVTELYDTWKVSN